MRFLLRRLVERILSASSATKLSRGFFPFLLFSLRQRHRLAGESRWHHDCTDGAATAFGFLFSSAVDIRVCVRVGCFGFFLLLFLWFFPLSLFLIVGFVDQGGCWEELDEAGFFFGDFVDGGLD